MKARGDEPNYRVVALLVLALWVCPVTLLGVGLRYRQPIEDWLKERLDVALITPTPFVTPTIDWPTPSPTNTPRPTPTSVPTPTRNPWQLGGEVDTIAAAICYEALTESERGQRAVGYVILHRCELTGKRPHDVLQKDFFGSEEGPDHLGRMKDWWKPDGTAISVEMWAQITEVAEGVANRWLWDEFPTSTHFYSTCVLEEPPTWVEDLEFLGEIGCHRFYGLKGG